MAAVKSKVDESSFVRHEQVTRVKISDLSSFGVFDGFLVVLSVCAFVVDLCTDLVLVVKYFNHGHMYWALSTLLLVLIPATIIQIFSMRWHFVDKVVDWYFWLSHICLLGVVQRYLMILKTGLEARATRDPTEYQRLYHQQNDVSMLHLFESFMESAPQLVLQLYIMISVGDWWSWTGISAAASLLSLAWAVAAYTRAMRRSRPDKRCVSWRGLALQALWRAGLLGARIATLVLFAVGFRAWLFLLVGIHWLGMTTWIIFQKTDFCPTSWEERIYNCVVGVIYCFCFFNLKEGQSRRRVIAFYTIMIVQNFGCLGLFIVIIGTARPLLVQVGSSTIVGGTVLGMCGMILYYRFFHPVGPIKLYSKNIKQDAENGSPVKTNIDGVGDGMSTIRSLKHRWHADKEVTKESVSATPQDDSTNADDSCTDKKLLLNHWVSCPTTAPTETVDNSESQSIPEEVHMSSENNVLCNANDILKQKRRGICSSEALELELKEENELTIFKETTIDDKMKRRGICACESELQAELELEANIVNEEITQISECEELRKQKRRGICSSVDLCLELDEEASCIPVTDNVSPVRADLHTIEDMKQDHFTSVNFDPDLLKNVSDLKPSTIRLLVSEESTCDVLSAQSEVLSAPSEVLSAHDYENICAVNIARETWGLRSWRGYSDIETWLHDDSVVRDRRSDTLTSTATTFTSASSDHSAGSSDNPVAASESAPPPLPCRRPRIQRSRQDDYLDTLVDDLAEYESSRPLAEFISEPEGDTSMYMARPYIIDQHGTLFPLTTLDTIMEEIEESSTDTGDSVRHWHKHGSASTLVATIDEIRHGNSECNLYNSSETLWDTASTHIEQISCKDTVTEEDTYEQSFATGVRTFLSPEEILFLSKLKPSDHNLPSPVNSARNANISPKTSENTLCNEDSVENDLYDNVKPFSFKNNLLKKKNGCRSQGKFLVLREKFEAKQNYNCNLKDNTGNCSVDANDIDTKSYTQGFTSSTETLVPCTDADNTPAVIQRIHQWNSFLRTQTSCNPKVSCEKTDSLESKQEKLNVNSKSNFSNLKERRSVFLKQVLSPPKFQNWSKKKNCPITSVQVRAS